MYQVYKGAESLNEIDGETIRVGNQILRECLQTLNSITLFDADEA
jgi:hypothetical protein